MADPIESVEKDIVAVEAGSLQVNSAQEHSKTVEREGLALVEGERVIPLSNVRKTTKKWEVIAYYLFYIADGGLGPSNFAPAQFQNLIAQAGYDPSILPKGSAPCGSGECVLNWGGGERSITALVLDLNGIAFAVQSVLFLFLGPYCDYGSWRPYILIASSIISWAVGFSWLGVMSPAKWQGAMVLYVLGSVAANISYAYFYAAFTGLARDLPETRESEEAVLHGEKDPAEHVQLDMLARNKMSNMSLIVGSFGALPVLCIAIGICKAVGTSTTEQNTRVYSYLVAYYTAVWIVLGLPWFLLEQYRPGAKPPTGTRALLLGPMQMWQGMKEVYKLKQTLLYLLAFFLFNDTLNTMSTLIGTLQNTVISYDTTTLVYIYLLGFGSQGMGVLSLHLIQRRFVLKTKWMLMSATMAIWLACIWGLLGLATDRIGYKNYWEFWFYQVYSGLFIGPWYSFSYTMVTEVIPAGKTFLFFSLFSIVGKTSSFIGPFVTSAILNDTNNNTSLSFVFVVATGAVGCGILWLVDSDKSKLECKEYLDKEAAALYTQEELEDREG